VIWSYLTASELRHPELRRRWAELLGAEPGSGNIDSSAASAELMDRILFKVWAGLREISVPHWLEQSGPAPQPGQNPERCGLVPLLPFLATGKQAILDTARSADAAHADLPEEQVRRLEAELLRAFDTVARREMEHVCGQCHVGGPCPFAGQHGVPLRR